MSNTSNSSAIGRMTRAFSDWSRAHDGEAPDIALVSSALRDQIRAECQAPYVPVTHDAVAQVGGSFLYGVSLYGVSLYVVEQAGDEIIVAHT